MNITELKNSQVDLNPAELEMAVRKGGMSRREMLRRLGLASGAAMMASYGLSGTRAFAAGVVEVYPTSPLILNPFSDPLPIPAPLQPSDPSTWATPPPTTRAIPPGTTSIRSPPEPSDCRTLSITRSICSWVNTILRHPRCSPSGLTDNRCFRRTGLQARGTSPRARFTGSTAPSRGR